MPVTDQGPCLTPDELAATPFGVWRLSKDVRGELRVEGAQRRECRTFEDRTLLTRHRLRLEARGADCDGKLDTDGRIRAELTTVFDDDGMGRGVHAGRLDWQSDSLVIRATFRGMTNVGTHREPPLKPVETCHQPGVLRGVLCGRVVRAKDDALRGAQVTASYRFEIDPDRKGGQGELRGTIEGMVLQRCSGKPGEPDACTEFAADLPAGQHPNPLQVGGHSVGVDSYDGSPLPALEVGPQGLNAGWFTTISLAAPADAVSVTVVTYHPAPIRVTVYDASGAVVDVVELTGPQGVPQTATLHGAGIVKVTVEAPQNETFMTGFCVSKG